MVMQIEGRGPERRLQLVDREQRDLDMGVLAQQEWALGSRLPQHLRPGAELFAVASDTATVRAGETPPPVWNRPFLEQALGASNET